MPFYLRKEAGDISDNRSTGSGTIETLHPSTMRPPLNPKTNRRSK